MYESVPRVWPSSVACWAVVVSASCPVTWSRLRLDEFGQTEVDDLDLAAIGHEDVAALDVAMDDAEAVRGVQRVGDLDAHFDQRVDRERSAVDAPPQRLAADHLHHEERQIAVPPDVEQRADIRMVERGRGPGFALEALEGDRILRELHRKEFDGDLPAEPRVLGPVDDTHAAFANFLQQAIVRNSLANHRGIKIRW